MNFIPTSFFSMCRCLIWMVLESSKMWSQRPAPLPYISSSRLTMRTPFVHTRAVFSGTADLDGDEVTEAMHAVAGEARTIEQRLAQSDWVVGESVSAADMVIFPGVRLLLRALGGPQARALSARFLPLEINYPALGRWLARVAALPGYERT